MAGGWPVAIWEGGRVHTTAGKQVTSSPTAPGRGRFGHRGHPPSHCAMHSCPAYLSTVFNFPCPTLTRPLACSPIPSHRPPLSTSQGPHDTPYEGGLFVFDVFFPAGYPDVPPLMLMHNTGDGRGRYNPNLYADGKVRRCDAAGACGGRGVGCRGVLCTSAGWSGDGASSSSQPAAVALWIPLSVPVWPLWLCRPSACDPLVPGTRASLTRTLSLFLVSLVPTDCLTWFGCWALPGFPRCCPVPRPHTRIHALCCSALCCATLCRCACLCWARGTPRTRPRSGTPPRQAYFRSS